MSTIVLVHGLYGGAWEWEDVARELRLLGHQVFTPTLTGLGGRAHLGTEVDLDTHVEDVVAVLRAHDLTDAVLCGHSYGGFVATGAADREPERVELLVYLDALVPRNGQSVVDLLPGEFGEFVRSRADEHGHGSLEVLDMLLPTEVGIDRHRRRRYVERLEPHPVATLLDPLHLTGAVEGVPRAFVRCSGDPDEGEADPVEPFAERARREGWSYREVDVPHDLQLFDPGRTAAVLHELATGEPVDTGAADRHGQDEERYEEKSMTHLRLGCLILIAGWLVVSAVLFVALILWDGAFGGG
jgi:pimeloyl-ACP methyl ester carboxylesterase